MHVGYLMLLFLHKMQLCILLVKLYWEDYNNFSTEAQYWPIRHHYIFLC